MVHAPVDLFAHQDSSSDHSQLGQLRQQKARQLEQASSVATEHSEGA